MRNVIYLVHLDLHEHNHFMMSFYKLKKQTMIMLLCDATYCIPWHNEDRGWWWCYIHLPCIIFGRLQIPNVIRLPLWFNIILAGKGLVFHSKLSGPWVLLVWLLLTLLSIFWKFASEMWSILWCCRMEHVQNCMRYTAQMPVGEEKIII